MRAYIFGENIHGQPDWYYTTANIGKPRRVRGKGPGSPAATLVFIAMPAEQTGVAYVMNWRALLHAIRSRNLFFRHTAAEAEAARRWQEKFGG